MRRRSFWRALVLVRLEPSQGAHFLCWRCRRISVYVLRFVFTEIIYAHRLLLCARVCIYISHHVVICVPFLDPRSGNASMQNKWILHGSKLNTRDQRQQTSGVGVRLGGGRGAVENASHMPATPNKIDQDMFSTFRNHSQHIDPKYSQRIPLPNSSSHIFARSF